ncbi:MAG TPA: hypothetical protein VMV49_03585, partial [Candidatus Deferrimicrobium sp.]|nr:hypothetical protein [Candidatus Deferrimicrobium sp.]
MEELIRSIKNASDSSACSKYLQRFYGIYCNNNPKYDLEFKKQTFHDLLLNLIFNSSMIQKFQTHQCIMDLLKFCNEDLINIFKPFLRMAISTNIIEICFRVIQEQIDIPHQTLMELISYLEGKDLIINLINTLLIDLKRRFFKENNEDPLHFLKRERVFQLFIDLHDRFREILNASHKDASYCCKKIKEFESHLLDCQNRDIQKDLSKLNKDTELAPIFDESVLNKKIKVWAPLRVGLS